MTVQEIEAACNLAEPPKALRHPLELPELTLVKMFYPYGFPMQVRTNATEVLERKRPIRVLVSPALQ